MKRTMILSLGVLAVFAVAVSAQGNRRGVEADGPALAQPAPAFVDGDGDGICDSYQGSSLGPNQGPRHGNGSGGQAVGPRAGGGVGSRNGSGYLNGNQNGRGFGSTPRPVRQSGRRGGR
jgi:hypothetical protein